MVERLGLPGRTGSVNKNTELGALNEIIKKLLIVNSTLTTLGGAGGATLTEQQAQTIILTALQSLLTSIDTSLDTANSPSHEELTNPVGAVYSGFKELSFVCSGTITVTVDGNSIIYPKTLGTSVVLGSTIKADTVSLNSVTFNGTGTVLITIKQ